ncbi:hypothetical protein F4677DRAFT_265645 [Hypoxylon crocopeplum]|nr:hypothetical protein F4677DRAFT_265645 [Hypoxylon crocopeplum]
MALIADATFLDVSIQFDPRRISIGFRNEAQVDRYHEIIIKKSFVKKMGLDSQVHGRFLSLRLPSRVTEIISSTSCGGFCLCFSEEVLASQWQEALLVWKFREEVRLKCMLREISIIIVSTGY